MGNVRKALEILKDCPYVTEDTLIVIESTLDTDFDYVSSLGFIVTKEKIYKTNKHVFVKRS